MRSAFPDLSYTIAAAKQFAEVLHEHVPACDDRTAALQYLRESAMMACAAIALDGRLK